MKLLEDKITRIEETLANHSNLLSNKKTPEAEPSKTTENTLLRASSSKSEKKGIKSLWQLSGTALGESSILI